MHWTLSKNYTHILFVLNLSRDFCLEVKKRVLASTESFVYNATQPSSRIFSPLTIAH